MITSNIDNIHSTDVHPSTGAATSGLIEGVNTAEAVVRHFKNTLNYIQSRKEGGGGATLGNGNGLGVAGEEIAGEVFTREKEEEVRKLFSAVEVAGPLLKLR